MTKVPLTKIDRQVLKLLEKREDQIIKLKLKVKRLENKLKEKELVDG